MYVDGIFVSTYYVHVSARRVYISIHQNVR